jgi:hypothetical protein
MIQNSMVQYTASGVNYAVGGRRALVCKLKGHFARVFAV